MVMRSLLARGLVTRRLGALLALGAAALVPDVAAAQAAADDPAAGAAQAQLSVDTSAPILDPPAPEPLPGDPGALLLTGKVGGILPLNGLDPFVTGGIEVGWIFAGTKQRIAALLDVTYTAPNASGTATDPRITGETFGWDIAQKELILQPTFMYRYTALGPLVPFAGIGPRIYFLETVGEGAANGVKFSESKEQSTRFGAGLPFGAEYALGPGGLMAELLLEWAPLDHRVTGDVSLLATSLFAGYRARF
jgi:hypothetical protein